MRAARKLCFQFGRRRAGSPRDGSQHHRKEERHAAVQQRSRSEHIFAVQGSNKLAPRARNTEDLRWWRRASQKRIGSSSQKNSRELACACDHTRGVKTHRRERQVNATRPQVLQVPSAPPTPSAAVTTSSSCCATRRKQRRIFDSVSLAAPWAPGTCVEAHTRCAKRITAVRCDSLSTRVRSSVGDHGAQAVARVERLDGLLGPGDALELVGDEMIERDLAADRLVDEHRHGVACLP